MKIEITDQGPVKKQMTVEIDVDAVAQETESVLRSYGQKAKIPGFRQGKAPMSVIRGRFSKEARDDVRERLVSRGFHEAMQEKGLKVLGEPILEEVSDEEGEPLRFRARFEVMPEVEVKDHKGVDAIRPKAELTDEELERAIDELRESHAKLVTDEDGEAGTGDVVIADIEGTPDEGEPFTRERMFIEVGATDNLPAFNDEVLGAKGGQALEFSVDYPKEYPTAELAGKSVAYKLQVHEIKRKVEPELDDEFAKDLGDFASMEELRSRIREDLQKRKTHETERFLRQSILDKVLLANPLVLPDTLVEGEIRYRLEELVRRLMMQGMDPEKLDLNWKELRGQQEEPARKAVHARLVLDAIARDEELEVADDEVEQRLRDDAVALGQKYEKFRADLVKQGGLEVLKNQLVREKSLDLLASVANIQNEE